MVSASVYWEPNESPAPARLGVTTKRGSRLPRGDPAIRVRSRILLVLVVVVSIIAWGQVSSGNGAAPSSAAGPKTCKQIDACRRATAWQAKRVARLERAVAWQKQHTKKEVAAVLDHSRGAQPFAYSAKLAFMACVTFSSDSKRCKPQSQMLAVGRCESGLQIRNPNPTSSADGWLQFLSSTWENTTAARMGFSRYDPIALALAAEAMSRRGWGAWAASRGCHGLG